MEISRSSKSLKVNIKLVIKKTSNDKNLPLNLALTPRFKENLTKSKLSFSSLL
jgi:hypothetical protein